MHRLIERGLMFGGLYHVDSPALVERYNRALEHLIGRRTALPDFHVDISGFSPEVGDELGDMAYLNPGGFNRKFILLSLRQSEAPLLEMKFSTTRDVLRTFIAANEAQLFTLTARDAVAGELQNSVWSIDPPDRLLDIRSVTVEADTTDGTVAEGAKLDALIRRFRDEDDAWWDDVLVARMIDLARRTGDVTRAPVTFETPTFRQDDFWTAHHGGLYVLRTVPQPGVLASTLDVPRLRDLDVVRLADRNAVAAFLQLNGLVQPIVDGRGAEAAAILREKLEIVAIDALAQAGRLPAEPDPRALRRAMSTHSSDLPDAFHSLAAVMSWAEGRDAWPRIDSRDPAYFHTLRAAPGPLRDKVNMLLAELAPEDFRQTYICHKPLFFARYARRSDVWKAWVAEWLATGYAEDRSGTWARLYAMDRMPRVRSGAPPPPPPPPPQSAATPVPPKPPKGPWDA